LYCRSPRGVPGAQALGGALPALTLDHIPTDMPWEEVRLELRYKARAPSAPLAPGVLPHCI
jgi:hypothetical protein